MIKRSIFSLLLCAVAALDLFALPHKAVYVPELSGAVKIDGKTDETVWQQAVLLEDFYQFKTGKPFPEKISARLWRDREKLYIAIQVPYPQDIKLKSWSARVELFAGNVDEPAFYQQYVWLGGRVRYNGAGESGSWESANVFSGGTWSSEAAIPLSHFRFRNGGMRFNLCITPPNSKISAVWENCGSKLYNIANYGELLLTDRDTAEVLRKTFAPVTGPWLHAPEKSGISIGFVTAFPAAAVVRYRTKGAAAWQTQAGDILWGARSVTAKNHQVHLSKLKGGVPYEYQIGFAPAGENQVKFLPEVREFTLPAAAQENLSFAVVSDIHNFRQRLNRLMPLVKGCDFLVNLGDMVNIANAPEFFLDGYLAGELEFAASRPLINLRGNHEFRGLMPELFFEYFRRPDNKPYFMSRLGNLCIIGLDAGEDGREPISMTILNGEREWLKAAVKSPEFQTAAHRIIVIHIPPMQKNSTTARVTTLFDGIVIGNNAEKVDLLLAGHTHKASFTPVDSEECTIYEPKMQKVQVVKMPFPVICNSGMGETMLKVEIKGNSLEVICLRKDGSELFRQKIK